MTTLILRIIIVFLLAFWGGKMFQLFKLPVILGWLITGMVVGPHALQLISQEIISSDMYKLIIDLLESLIGVMIGSELIWRTLRKSGKQIFTIAIFEGLVTFTLVTAIFALVFWIIGIPSYLALVIGSLALATAPAPSLAIVNECQTCGPVTKTLLPVVAIDDLLAIIVFFIVMIFTMQVTAGESLQIASLIYSLILPILIGGVSSVLFVSIPQSFWRHGYLCFITFVSLLFAANGLMMYMNHYVLANTQSNFMLLGIVYSAIVFNFISESKLHKVHVYMRPLLQFGMLLMIIHLGLPLDFRLITVIGPLAWLYILLRYSGKIFGTFVGARLSGASKSVQKYLGLTLLPHSGLSLIFAATIANIIAPQFPEHALLVQSIVVTPAIINEIVAVVLAKRAFRLAKELPIS